MIINPRILLAREGWDKPGEWKYHLHLSALNCCGIHSDIKAITIQHNKFWLSYCEHCKTNHWTCNSFDWVLAMKDQDLFETILSGAGVEFRVFEGSKHNRVVINNQTGILFDRT